MKGNRLPRYLGITFGISWGTWWLLALLIHTGLLTLSHPFGSVLFTIGGFGPTIGALFVLPEKLTPQSVWKFVFARKPKTLRYLLLFCVLAAAVMGLASMETNPSIPPYALPIVLLVLTLFGGGNEELGWRGVMQPMLEDALPFPAASLITGSVWAVWHLPLWFVDGSSQQTMSFILFTVYALFLSFWLAAIHKRSQCVFDCCIFHGLNNLLMSLFVIKVNWILAAGLLLILAISVFLWYKTPGSNTKTGCCA